jgi:2-C-methyl-D-erythritol 4-phosphate cytidylyltransferase
MPGVKYYAIIVAGGSGSRMQSDVPKQFMQLNGRPVLMHTIEAFHFSASAPEMILVLNEVFHQDWKDLCAEYKFTIPHQLVQGGEQRFHSVKNGLKSITKPAIVAIHDAVRPCISHEIIDSAYRQAEESGNAVVAVKSRDSIRQSTKTGTVSVNRDEIYLIQTPQVFRSEILNKAYEQEYRSEFTDDASVVESSGEEIRLIEGDTRNLKITYPEDILLAQTYLSLKK